MELSSPEAGSLKIVKDYCLYELVIPCYNIIGGECMSLWTRVTGYVRMHGMGYTLRRAGEMLSERILRSYDRRFRREQPDAAALAHQRMHQPAAGLISVAVPVFNTRPEYLTALIESLRSQTYENWEAVLYDGCSTDQDCIAALDEISDPRIRVIHGRENAGISGNTNLAVAQCCGEYIALCDHDDMLSPESLWRTAEAIAADQPDMLYSDEDKITRDGRLHTDPHRKPDFCPDNLRSGNYICHLMVVRREILMAVGGLCSAFDGSQDHDLALRISEVTRRIVHIPHILYHWRTVGSSMSHQHLARCQDAAARAVTEHMARIGYPGACTVEDGVLRLRYEVKNSLRVNVIRVPARDGYAFMNRAAAEAAGDVLLFLRDTVNGLTEEMISEMLMYAQRDDVGAVTPMLTDRRGRVTHAGFALTREGARCRNRSLPCHAGGWHGLNRTSYNVAAVSAACLMIRRDRFIPFDEGWQDAHAVVDWCLRLGEKGLRCVYTPHAKAQCEEAGMLDDFRFDERFLKRWPELRDSCAGDTKAV